MTLQLWHVADISVRWRAKGFDSNKTLQQHLTGDTFDKRTIQEVRV